MATKILIASGPREYQGEWRHGLGSFWSMPHSAAVEGLQKMGGFKNKKYVI